MAALLRKDFYVMGKYSRILLSLALLFSIFPASRTLGNTYAMLMAFLVSLSSLAADEACKWDRFAMMLPYRVEQIVWSKYLLSYIYALVCAAITAVGAVMRGRLWKPEAAEWGETMETIFMLVVVVILLITVSLPLIYRFGSKTRNVVLPLMAVGMGISISVFPFVSARGVLYHPAVLTVAVAVIAGATYLSYRLSVYFYRRKWDCAYYS